MHIFGFINEGYVQNIILLLLFLQYIYSVHYTHFLHEIPGILLHFVTCLLVHTALNTVSHSVIHLNLLFISSVMKQIHVV